MDHQGHLRGDHQKMMMRATRRRQHAADGFTLVELAIVVTIVGVLAVIAVMSYRKYIIHSKVSEAYSVINAIRIAQEDNKAERGTYADLGANYCPVAAGSGNIKAAWTTTCSGGTANWLTLPVHIDGPVSFAYATQAGTTTFAPPTDANWVNWGTPTAGPWYVVMAKCDLDGNSANFTQLVGSGYTNQIFIRNEGL
jgi:prepilin-type N-terminal cleavage/methylation domain-containing protein